MTVTGSICVSVSCGINCVWGVSSAAGIPTVSDEVVDSSVFSSEVGACGRVTIGTTVLGFGLVQRYCHKTLPGDSFLGDSFLNFFSFKDLRLQFPFFFNKIDYFSINISRISSSDRVVSASLLMR